MVDQMNIQRPLKSIRRLCIGVRTATKGTITAAGSCILPFQVIGMDVLIMDILHSFWMFRLGSLVFGTLPATLVFLTAFIFNLNAATI
ncbi:MAG: hypothetical protein HQL78_01990 [Magnetococcales bacterium]|nr:hypothetical protein [Magnetococcales bacterium]